jgi:hypothetical protein
MNQRIVLLLHHPDLQTDDTVLLAVELRISLIRYCRRLAFNRTSWSDVRRWAMSWTRSIWTASTDCSGVEQMAGKVSMMNPGLIPFRDT